MIGVPRYVLFGGITLQLSCTVKVDQSKGRAYQRVLEIQYGHHQSSPISFNSTKSIGFIAILYQTPVCSMKIGLR